MNGNKPTRTSPDPLTIAYMAIGAEAAINKYAKEMPEKMNSILESNGGRLNVISEVIGHALLADMVGDYIDAHGMHKDVWCYRIEEFGFNLVANAVEPISRQYASDILLDTLSTADTPRSFIKCALSSGIGDNLLYAEVL
jgi:hypothetical protein